MAIATNPPIHHPSSIIPSVHPYTVHGALRSRDSIRFASS